MRVPSGEKTGCVSSSSIVVRRRVWPGATAASATRQEFVVPACADSRLVMAIVFPSGDQESGDGAAPGGWAMGRLQEPEVTRRALPPAAGTTQTWDGVGSSRMR